jgi:hypothetical protein
MLSKKVGKFEVFDVCRILYLYGGHPAPAGRALPNLINAVGMFKIKVKVKTIAVFGFRVLTALKGWVGHAPTGRGALHIMIILLLLLFDFFDF